MTHDASKDVCECPMCNRVHKRMMAIQERYGISDAATRMFTHTVRKILGGVLDIMGEHVSDADKVKIGGLYDCELLIGRAVFEFASAEYEVRNDPELWAAYQAYRAKVDAEEAGERAEMAKALGGALASFVQSIGAKVIMNAPTPADAAKLKAAPTN